VDSTNTMCAMNHDISERLEIKNYYILK